MTIKRSVCLHMPWPGRARFADRGRYAPRTLPCPVDLYPAVKG